jgi:hypothetical protein
MLTGAVLAEIRFLSGALEKKYAGGMRRDQQHMFFDLIKFD